MRPMNEITDYVEKFDTAAINGLITTIIMVAVLWTVRALLIRAVSRRSEILSPDQRRWVQTVRSMVWALVILGLIMIWAPQLHTMALSLTAFVVAIVIATKEVIMCIMGAFMRVSTAPFRMGDWINIDGNTGEVVDINAFSTKIQELEAGSGGSYNFTGKIIQIPNSRFFTFPIENLSYLKNYKAHQFTLAFQGDTLDPALLVKKLEAIVQKHTAPFQDEAAQTCKRVKRASSIPLPDPAPRVSFTAKDFNNFQFTVRAYLPIREVSAVSSKISTEFLSEVVRQKRKKRQEEVLWGKEKAA